MDQGVRNCLFHDLLASHFHVIAQAFRLFTFSMEAHSHARVCCAYLKSLDTFA